MDTELFHILYWFITGSKGTQLFFCDLIKKALDYKYKEYRNVAIPVTETFLQSNPVFELTERDKIRVIANHIVDGKKFKEIYITLIFARLLDTADYFRDLKVKFKKAFISYVENIHSEVDTYIFLTPRKEIRSKQKIYWPPGTVIFSLQIKECFKYEDLYSKKMITSQELNIDKLFNVKRLKYYDNFILIYLRGFFEIDLEQLKEDLKKQHLDDKNIFLIGMPWSEVLPEKYFFNIWDVRQEKTYSVSFEPCDLFKSMPRSAFDLKR